MGTDRGGRLSSGLHRVQLVSAPVLVSDRFGGTKGPLPVADGAPFAIGTPVTVPYSLRYATLAGLLGGALVWFGPPGTDLAAHLYQRAFFDSDGFSLWNNYWYAGRYSFVTYSLLYYPLAALVGHQAARDRERRRRRLRLRRSSVEREWGGCARWAAWVFAVALAASRALGRVPLHARDGLRARCAGGAPGTPLQAASGCSSSRPSPRVRSPSCCSSSCSRPRTRARAGSWRGPGLPVARHRASGCCSGGSSPANGRFPFAFSEFARRARVLPRRSRLHLARRAGPAALRASSRSTAQPVSSATSSPPTSAPTSCASASSRSRSTALTLSLRRWRPLLPALAALALAACLEHDPAASQLRARRQRPVGESELLGAGDPLPAPRGSLPRYRVEAVDTIGPLGGRLPARGGDPARPRLVPPGRLPAERAPLPPRSVARAYVRLAAGDGVPATSCSPTAPTDYSSSRRRGSSGAGARGSRSCFGPPTSPSSPFPRRFRS